MFLTSQFLVVCDPMVPVRIPIGHLLGIVVSGKLDIDWSYF